MSVAVCRSSAACFESILALPAALPAAGSTWLSLPMIAEQQEQEQEQEQELNEPTKNSLLPLQVEEEHVKDDEEDESERPPGQLDIWSSIQTQKAKQEAQGKEEPYVHPLMRRSSSLLSQKSLEICTESLGSETGSDDFFSSDNETDFFTLIPKTNETEQQQQQQQQQDQSEYSDNEEEEFEHVESARSSGGGIRKELATVNYHCSISRRSSQPRCFPPPLPSISRRDGPCLQMRPRRRDGRLVVEAVTVPSQNYLHAERQNGRLLLSFINTTSSHNPRTAIESINNVAENTTTETELIEEFQQTEDAADQEEEMLEVEDEQAEEEEVEVVDRGTVVEVKVSTQPQQNSSGGAAAMKVHRSSIVINKFVSCMPVNNDQEKSNAISAAAAAAEEEDTAPPLSPVRRLATTNTTTAAAAAVAASSLSALSAADGIHSSTNDNKLLFTSRRRNREELLHDMRRCSQLRKPLFIWEPCFIATATSS